MFFLSKEFLVFVLFDFFINFLNFFFQTKKYSAHSLCVTVSRIFTWRKLVKSRLDRFLICWHQLLIFMKKEREDPTNRRPQNWLFCYTTIFASSVPYIVPQCVVVHFIYCFNWSNQSFLVDVKRDVLVFLFLFWKKVLGCYRPQQ